MEHLFGRAVFVLAPLLVGLLGACGDAADLSAEDFLERARKYHQEGKLPASIIELKNALEKDPENTPARLLLGRVYLAYGNSAGAEKELVRARDLGSDWPSVAPDLGRAWLNMRKYQEILKEIVTDEAAPAAGNGAVLALRGSALAGLGKISEAEQTFKDALAVDPKSTLALVGLANIAMRNGDNAQAESALNEAVKVAPGDPDVLITKGDYEFSHGKYAEAVKNYQKLVDRWRFNPSHRLRLARAQIAIDAVDEALANIESALKIVPKFVGALYLKAVAAYQSKDYKTADILTKEILASFPEHLPSQLLAGAANFGMKQFEQSTRYLQGFIADVPSHELARRLYGVSLLNIGRGKDAALALQPLLDQSDNDAVLLSMIGVAALQDSDLEKGRTYFERAVKADPGDAAMRAELGLVQIGLGNLTQGVQELEKAINLDPKLDRAVFNLFAVRMRGRQYDHAIGVAKRIQENQPNHPVGFTLAGIANAAKGDTAGARTAFDKALEIAPGDPNASISLADLEARDGNPDKERKLLDVALKYNADSVPVLLRLAFLEAKSEKWTEARAWAEKAVAVGPGTLEPIIVLARLHLRAGAAAKALSVGQRILREHPGNPNLLKAVGRAQLALNQADSAAVTFRSLVEVQPDSLEARYLLAEAYRALRDWPRHREQLEKAAILQPKSAQIRAKLGAAEVGLGNFQQAIGELEAAIELDPKLERAAFDLFSARMQVRQFDQALEIARRFQVNRPKSPLGFTLAGMAYTAKGEFAAARKAFGKALEIKPGIQDASINLAFLEMRKGNSDAARALLQTSLKHNPKSVPVLMRLATVEATVGNWDLVREQVEKAMEAAPNALEPKVVLARLHLRDGNTLKARDVAKSGLQKHPTEPTLLTLLGRTQLMTGQTEDAANTLRILVDVRPKDLDARYLLAAAYRDMNDPARYREMLESILVIDPVQARAKIDLARLLGQQGDMESAIRLLDGLKRSTPDNADVVELDGEIALLQNRISDAISLLRKAANIKPSSRLTRKLAQIQWRAGDRKDGQETLKRWLKQFPKDNAVRMALANQYLEMNNLEGARSNFSMVVESQPDSWIANNELAWVIFRIGDPKAALPYAERALELTKGNPAALDTAGVILLELGDAERATRILRRAAEILPQNQEIQHHFAQALAKQDGKDEARRILRQILSGKAAFPDRKKAESLLNELGG